MSNLTLGLDLGPTSIGWAVIDEDNHSIVAMGVRVFPEGVDRDTQGGEKSKSQTRREARGTRRQIARRAQRRQRLRALLTARGLLPSEGTSLERLLAANPYQLRRRALDDRLELHEIGRVLLHLNQRRGFLSNRKTDRAKESDAKGMLGEISELARQVKDTGSRTLGEYLARLDEGFDHTSSTESEKIRVRHTRRDMYEAEFEAIWETQRRYHAKLLSDDLKGMLNDPNANDDWIRQGIIFGQRRMYWPRSVIGRCELEPKLQRCSRADRSAQRFRILQEVNNLRLLDRSSGDERSLTPEERATLVEYLATSKQRTFEQIRKKLALDEAVQFNFERGDRGKLKGNETDAALASKRSLGKKWHGLSEGRKDRIVGILIKEEHDAEAKRRLLEECDLTPDDADRALLANVPDGHMSFSREAICKLLPYLERGMMLMGDDASNSALHAAGYLRPDERHVAQRDYLPPCPDLPNPIVRQALVEVRKVVNAVIREYGRPSHIHIELAREAKKSFDQRREIRFENKKRQRLREDAAAEIEELGHESKRSAVDRYILWKEQHEYCLYCGRKIGVAHLFDGDVDVDHILPRWRSLDDSLANKVVCHRRCNHEKGQCTPWEWLGEGDPEAYQALLRVARVLPYNKQRKLQQKDVALDDFVERQLRDTAYIARRVTQYLQCLGARIVCPRGQMTAELRHWWGLNTILDSEGRGQKNRADHRHHAIDAVTIALTDTRRLHLLANARGRNMPLPWPTFRQDVETMVTAINVSHRVRRRLAGHLHEATIYGRTQKHAGGMEVPRTEARPWAGDWREEDTTYVRRKPVTDITSIAHIEKIRDTTIREILKQHLRDRGIDCDQPGKIPGDAFKGSNTPRMPSGVPIKRIRMLEKSRTFRRVSERRPSQFVKPGSNHHIVYRIGDNGNWAGEVVTMWDAALRARNRRPVVDRSSGKDGRFIMSLSISEMFRIDDDSGERVLCVVRKMKQTDGLLDYKLHTDVRKAADINSDNLYLSPKAMKRRNACKVTVDPLGRIRHAND